MKNSKKILSFVYLSLFGVFGSIVFVPRTQAMTIEGYDTLNGVKVISNDGRVAYTEDGEEWRFDRQWYAQNETKTIADLIHHKLGKESETIESTSTSTIESDPSSTDKKADMVEDTSSSTSTLFSEKTSVPTQISNEKRKGGISSKLVESSSAKADTSVTEVKEEPAKADTSVTEVKEEPQNHKSNESVPKVSQKEDNLSTMTEGENTENDFSIEKGTIDSTIKISSSNSTVQMLRKELPKTGENRKPSAVMKWSGLFLLLVGIGTICLNKNSYNDQ